MHIFGHEERWFISDNLKYCQTKIRCLSSSEYCSFSWTECTRLVVSCATVKNKLAFGVKKNVGKVKPIVWIAVDRRIFN